MRNPLIIKIKVSFLGLWLIVFEREEHNIDFPVSIPALIEFSLSHIQFQVGDFEPNSYIGFPCKQNKLEVLVRSLNSLFKGRHETILRLCARLYLRILYLEHNLSLPCFLVHLFLESIHGFPNFYSSDFRSLFLCLRIYYRVSGLTRCPTSQIRLMFLALCVGQVTTFI